MIGPSVDVIESTSSEHTSNRDWIDHLPFSGQTHTVHHHSPPLSKRQTRSKRRKKPKTSAKSYSTKTQTSMIDTQASVVSITDKTKNYFDALANKDTEKIVQTDCFENTDEIQMNKVTDPTTKKQTIKPVTVKVDELNFPYKLLKTVLKKLKFQPVVQVIDGTHMSVGVSTLADYRLLLNGLEAINFQYSLRRPADSPLPL